MDDQLTTGAAPRRQPAQNVGGDGAPMRQSRRRRRRGVTGLGLYFQVPMAQLLFPKCDRIPLVLCEETPEQFIWSVLIWSVRRSHIAFSNYET